MIYGLSFTEKSKVVPNALRTKDMHYHEWKGRLELKLF